MELEAAFKIIISIALGAAIGLEREVHEKNDEHPETGAIIGLRSFALITGLGTVTGFIFKDFNLLAAIIAATVMALLLIHYALNSIQTKDIGITTELAVIFSFIIGVLIAINAFPTQLTIALTVILILILSYKERIKSFVDDVEKTELMAFVGYALIALVILPFLPNKDFTIGDIPSIEQFISALGGDLGAWKDIQIFNPFKTWLIVALITGIDIAGYVLERTIGQGKGLLLSSMVGGFISSTATTQSLAQQSKETHTINKLVAAAVFANFVSFFPPLFLVATINGDFLVSSLPTFIILILSSLGIGMFFFWQKDKAAQKDVKLLEKKNTTIFALEPALKFAGIYLLIRATSKIAIELFGQSGFLITSALGALTGIDAVVINTAELAGKGINFDTAVLAFIIINAVNLIGKTVYSFMQGNKAFAMKFGASMVAIIVASLAGLLFV